MSMTCTGRVTLSTWYQGQWTTKPSSGMYRKVYCVFDLLFIWPLLLLTLCQGNTYAFLVRASNTFREWPGTHVGSGLSRTAMTGTVA